MNSYQEFLKKKLITTMPTGFDPASMPDQLYPYQADLAKWACKRGKAAFNDTMPLFSEAA